MFNPHKNINLSIETAAKTHVLFYSVGLLKNPSLDVLGVILFNGGITMIMFTD